MRVLQASEIELVSGAGALDESFFFSTGPSLTLGYEDYYQSEDSAAFGYVKSFLRSVTGLLGKRGKEKFAPNGGHQFAMGIRG